MKKLAIWTAVAVLAVSCLGSSAEADLFGFGRRKNGSGQLERETRKLASFESIRLSCSVDLHVILGDDQSVVVVADENLLEYIETEVDSRGTLRISSEESFDSRYDLIVEITIPSLEQLRLSGSGDAKIENLREKYLRIKVSGSGDVVLDGEVTEMDISISGSGGIILDGEVDKMDISISGSGDIDLEGKARRVDISVSGSGDIDARDFIVEEVDVRINGSGDVEVYATEYFDGSISGSGDINVYGSPRHWSRHVSGSGDIRKRR